MGDKVYVQRNMIKEFFTGKSPGAASTESTGGKPKRLDLSDLSTTVKTQAKALGEKASSTASALGELSTAAFKGIDNAASSVFSKLQEAMNKTGAKDSPGGSGQVGTAVTSSNVSEEQVDSVHRGLAEGGGNISRDTAKDITKYIENNKEKWVAELQSKNQDFKYIKAEPRTITVFKDGTIIVNLKSKAKLNRPTVEGRELGEGSCKKVKTAFHYNCSKIVAQSKAFGMGVIFQENEANMLTKFKGDPHILQVITVSVHGQDKQVFTTEFMNKGDVSSCIGQSSITRENRVDIATQALKGLSSMHKAGCSHNDVKLDNIFLRQIDTPDGPKFEAKLADLGLAHEKTEGTEQKVDIQKLGKSLLMLMHDTDNVQQQFKEPADGTEEHVFWEMTQDPPLSLEVALSKLSALQQK